MWRFKQRNQSFASFVVPLNPISLLLVHLPTGLNGISFRCGAAELFVSPSCHSITLSVDPILWSM